MEINFIDPAIGLIDNVFLENEELIDAAENGQWRDGTAGNGVNPDVRITSVHDIDPNSEIHQELLQTIIDGINKYAEKFKGLRISQGEHLRIMRYNEGGFYGVHADGGPGNVRILSTVLFLNDDFEGGELIFPNQDISIKPKAGQLVLFPSNYAYAHESTKITKGIKYCAVSWFK